MKMKILKAGAIFLFAILLITLGFLANNTALPGEVGEKVITIAHELFASEKVLAAADYTCDGTADDVQIQAAIDALPASGGQIRILGGTYYISAKILTRDYAVDIIGVGQRATILSLVNGVNDDMFLIGAGVDANAPGSKIRDMELQGNNAGNTSGSGIRIQNGLANQVVNCWIEDFNDNGIEILGASAVIRADLVRVHDCWVLNNGDSGIYNGQWAYGGMIQNNYISDNGVAANVTAGIYLEDAVDVIIDGNEIWQNSRANILVDGAGDTLISNNDLGSATYEHIWLYGNGNTATIIGNLFTDPSLAGAGLAAAIKYGKAPGEVFEQLNITGNNFVDISGLFTYWIAGAGGGGTGIVTSNTFRGVPATGAFALSPVDFQISHNRGWGAGLGTFKTENSGLATVLNGNVNVVVAHGLGFAPTTVVISPKENPTNAVTFWWVDNIGAANFTINIDANPGVSNLDFDWLARYGNGN